MRKRFAWVLCLSVAALRLNAAAPEWGFETFISVPYNNTLFLARDASDNVYVTTFNTSPKTAEVVAFKISNALGNEPKVTAFDRFLAPEYRGYAGVTVDADNNVYLSADQGDGLPSFIKKFKPSLEPDASFGTNGILASTKIRILGLASYKKTILAAVAWGRFLAINSAGDYLGMTPDVPLSQQATIRDIDFIPSTQEVVGVDRDNVYVFTGGNLNNLGAYQLRTLMRGNGRQAAGSSIYYDQPADRIYYTLFQSRQLGTFSRAERKVDVLRTASFGEGGAQPADTVISSDGKTLFVSDMRSASVMRYRKGAINVAVAAPKTRSSGDVVTAVETSSAPGAVAAAKEMKDIKQTPATTEESLDLAAKALAALGTPAPPAPKPAPESLATPVMSAPTPPPAASPKVAVGAPAEATPATLPPLMSLPTQTATAVTAPATPIVPTTPVAASGTINWAATVDDAFKTAAASGKKVGLFFFSPESNVSKQVEKQVFSDPSFAAKYPNVIWTKQDVSGDPTLLTKYNFFKVPVVILFSADRKELTRFEGALTSEAFDAGYNSAK